MDWCNVVAWTYWTHSEQVWVSGYKPQWNNQMTPIYVNTQLDMICIDVISTLFGIFPQNDWDHSVQVWVSGYELHWNSQVTSTCLLMNTPPDMVGYDITWIDVALTLKIFGPTVSRYEFQIINWVGIIRWHLYSWIHNLYWCNIDFIWHFLEKDWIHNVQVWISGNELHWINQMTP